MIFQILIPSWLHFFRKFHQDASKMLPRWPTAPQLGAQDGLKAAKEAPQRLQELAKSCPGGVLEAAESYPDVLWNRERPKNRPISRPESLQTSMSDHFGENFRWFLVHSR